MRRVPRLALRLRSAAVLALVSCAFAASAAAESSLRVDVPAGARIAQSGTYLYMVPPATLVVSNAFLGDLYVDARGTDPYDYWTIGFYSRTGTNLSRGFYTGTLSGPDAGHPGLHLARSSADCGGLFGAFQIKRLAYSSGHVAALWATFELTCPLTLASIHGEVRYNVDVPLAVDAPLQRAVERAHALSVTVSSRAASGIATLGAAGVPAGATFTDNHDGSGSLDWTPALDQLGEHVVAFFGSDAVGHRDTAFTRIEVTGENSLHLESAPGDPVGQGASLDLAPGAWLFHAEDVQGYAFDNAQVRLSRLDATGSELDYWALRFGVAYGETLRVGAYPIAVKFGQQTFGQAGLTTEHNAYECSALEGSYQIRRFRVGARGVLESFWATFEQRCNGAAGGLTGDVRINADVTVVVRATPGGAFPPGRPLEFPVTASDVRGQAVTLSAGPLPVGASFDATGGANGTFRWTPGLDQLGTYDVAFYGVAADGARDSVKTRLVIPGIYSLNLQSDAGDPVGRGGTYRYGLKDGAFWARTNEHKGVSLSFTQGYFNGWGLDFAAPGDAPLAVGRYDGAVRYPWGSVSLPRLYISTGGSYCSAITGSFEVRRLTLAPDGRPECFWATFEQHCEGATPALRGEIRYNTPVPLVVSALDSASVQSGTDLLIPVTALALGGAHVSLSATLPAGASFTDHGDNTGTFEWTPAREQSGEHIVVFRGLTALGETDSALTLIHVIRFNRPPLARAGGPYEGVVGEAVLVDGTASSDPDGDPLDYLWDAGGWSVRGAKVSLTYWSPGVYPLALTVSDGELSSTDRTTVSIHARLPARAFTTGGSLVTRLPSGKPLTWVQIEPVGGTFQVTDVDLGSVQMMVPVADSVRRISALAGMTRRERDTDRNGVDEISAAFAKEDLRRLLDGIVGRARVTAAIEGRVKSGDHFSAWFDLDVVGARKGPAPTVMLSPARPEAEVELESTGTEPVRVRIYDLSGRVVRTLYATPSAGPGPHTLRFGLGGSGSLGLPSGLYYYRPELPGVSAGRIIVLK